MEPIRDYLIEFLPSGLRELWEIGGRDRVRSTGDGRQVRVERNNRENKAL